MSMVHQLSDQQLLQMIQKPTSPVMQQSALQEMQFRHQARTGPAAMGQQAQQQPQHPMAAQANQGVQQNIAQGQVDKLGGGIGQLPAQAVEGMAAGGIVAFSGEDGSSVQAQPWYSGIRDFMFDYPGKPQQQDTGQGFFPVNGPTGGYARAPSPPARAPASNGPGYASRFADAVAMEGLSPELAAQAMHPGQRAAALAPSAADRADPRNYDSHNNFNPNHGPIEAPKGNLTTGPSWGTAPPSQYAYNGAPADRPLPEEAQARAQNTPPTPEDLSFYGVIGKRVADRYPETDPASETLQKQMAATEAAKRANTGLSWLHAGAAMLQSTSPFAAVALGKGVDAYATSKEAGQAAEQAGLAHIAQQQTEGYKAQMGYAGQVDSAMAHSYGAIRQGMMYRAMQADVNTRATFEKADQAAQTRIQAEYKDQEDHLRLNPTANAAALAALDQQKALKYQQYTQQFMQQFNSVTHNGIGQAAQYNGPQPLYAPTPGTRVVGGGQ
jgi:hypothetical protein